MGGAGKVPGTLALLVLEVARGRHGMDEIPGGVHATEGRHQRIGVEYVPRDDLDIRRDTRPKLFGSTGRASQAIPSLVEQAQQSSADVSARARDQTQR
jgi:hypothetical protein